MGLPFVALAAASSLMFKNLGISDTKIAFWTSLNYDSVDIKTTLESVARNV